MSETPSPAKFIRTKIFDIPSQAAFAELLGLTQSAIARWETGARGISAKHKDAILALATKRGVDFQYSYFFEVPESEDA